MEERRKGRKKTSIGKLAGILVAGFLILLIAGYFILTSSAFIKGVVLPRAGDAIHAKITADDVSLSPFSQVRLNNLRVQTTGNEPLLTAESVLVRYALMDIIRGNINVDQIAIVKPVVQIIEEADGSSNLDPILEDSDSSETDTDSTEPTRLSIGSMTLTNGIVRQIQKTKEGGLNRTELSNLNLVVTELANGKSGKLSILSDLAMEQRSGGTNDTLQGRIEGGYSFSMSEDLMPRSIEGSSTLAVTSGTGAYASLEGFSSSLNANLTPTEIRQVALNFSRNDQSLGQVRVSGPLDLEKMEGKVRLEIASLGANALALATAGMGYDFGNSVINSTNQVTITQSGEFFAASGNLAGSRITVTQDQLTTPEMNLNLNYEFSVNTADQSAVLQQLNVGASAGGSQFLRAELDQQMNLSWGETVKGYKDAAFRMILTNLNLEEWRAVIGTNIHSGVVNGTVAVVSQQDGRVLNLDLQGGVQNLSVQSETNRVDGLAAKFTSSGTVEELKTVNLPSYSITLQQGGQPLFNGTGALRYATETGDMNAQVTGEGALPRLLALASIPEATATAGTLKLNANYTSAGEKENVVGNLVVAGFTGTYDTYNFTNYQTALDYNLVLEGPQVEINQMAISLSQGFDAGGTVDLKGRYQTETGAGQITFKMVNLNENGLRPILASSLGENQLVSIAVDGTGEAKMEPAGESAIKGQIKVAKWVVRDPAGTLPQTPLSASFTIDGAMSEEVLTLRQVLVELSPTDRAKNAMRVQGKLDMSVTNSGPSELNIQSESFDVTPYYNMFAGSTNGAAEGQTASAPATEQTGPETEPEAMELPFQQFTVNLDIGKFYLRELAISNWTGKIAIQTNVVRLQPFQMDINGGKMSLAGTVDVGRPGYAYDIALDMGSVPLEPLANSLELTETNRLEGFLHAQAQIRGAGTTGASLQKNLAGNASLNLTNMNYQVVGPKLRRILVPISLALRVPELAETPINWVSAQTKMGDGVVTLASLAAESEAVLAEAAGTITLANVISNSTLNVPLRLSLRRSLAEKAGILPNNTPEDARYAPLPQFVTIKGTVGAPETDINKLAVAGILARGAASFGLGDEKTENILGNVSDLLTGQGGNTNTAGTNASPAAGLLRNLGGLLGGDDEKATEGTNKTAPAETNAPAGNLLRSLGGLLGGGQAATNAPAPTNNATTNQPQRINPFDILRGLNSDKKD